MDCTPKTLVWLSLHSSYSHSSLSLPLIHAACGGRNWAWRHEEFTVAEDPQEIVCAVAAHQPDLVCVPLYIFNQDAAVNVIKRLHSLMPDCAITAGGPECLGDGAGELLAELPFLRAVFRGEGEAAFADFLENMEQTDCRIFPADDTNGIFRDWTETAFPVNDPFFATDKAFVQYETSRGCPMGCLYCTSGNTGVRFKNLAQVAQELTALRERGVREIRLLDRTFNLPPERCAALLKMFRISFPDIHFHLELHPQFLNGEVRAELRNANPGQLHIEAGIQSLTPAVQRMIGRNSNTEAALDGLNFLASCAPLFETHADLLSGLPGQTFEDLLNDTDTLIRTAPAEIQLEVLKVLPGTPLRRQAAELHLTYAPMPPYDVIKTDLFPADEILLARKLSRLLDLTYNHPALHPVVRQMRSGIRVLFRFFLEKGLGLHTLYDLKKRFRLLTEFLEQQSEPAAAFELAYQWMLAGYPPEQTPFFTPTRCPAPEKHDRFLLLCGDENCAAERETKSYLLTGSGKKFIFSFNRKYECNRPAAVWSIR